MAGKNYKQTAFDVLVAIAMSDDAYVHDRTAAAKLILEYGTYAEADEAVRKPVYEADGTVV